MERVWQFIEFVQSRADVIQAFSIGTLIMMLAWVLVMVSSYAAKAYSDTRTRQLHCLGACSIVAAAMCLLIGALTCQYVAVYVNNLTGSSHDINLMALWWLALAIALAALLLGQGLERLDKARWAHEDY